MSKSLRSMSKAEQERALQRRLGGKERGLGYWAAVDAQARKSKPAVEKK